VDERETRTWVEGRTATVGKGLEVGEREE